MTTLIENSEYEARFDILGLKKLYKENVFARKVFDYFSSRKNNSSETTVERMSSVLSAEGESIPRGQIIQLFKALSKLGYGTFKSGRKGHQTRMVWSVGIVSLGQVAAGKAKIVEDMEIEPPAVEALQTEFGSVDHDLMEVSYPLRQNLKVSIELPKSLTQKEANRLSDFIKTLPFGDDLQAAT